MISDSNNLRYLTSRDESRRQRVGHAFRTKLLRSLSSALPMPKLTSELKRFVIFGQGRTGSTLLVDLLDSIPDIYCDGEILNRWKLLPHRCVERRLRSCKKSVYAFKLLSYQLEMVQHLKRPGVFLDWLEANGFKILHLRRSNVLMHAFSQIRARNAGYHLRSSDSEGVNQFQQKMEVDRAELEWWLDRMEFRSEFEAELLKGRNYLDLTYEKDLEDSVNWSSTLNRIVNYMGFDASVAPKTELRKINAKSLDQIVANPDEVRGWLKGTKYEVHVL